MKTLSIIIAAVLFVLGFALSTGVEQNPQQGIYAILCMGASMALFVYADSTPSASEKREVNL